ncbi:coiled-coil domain-containing protein 107 isoform X2 [Sciurus carolinensis]|uniref:coiled-coil domain-containing protein 107 isoform X2 n=1 Tax=Sciurus carolinensis TaxID=30640 RepID=UPI001FB2876D|nr:coiled-coil domain-containing protein 107 isoform X2 [Sciurus carolinensis]
MAGAAWSSGMLGLLLVCALLGVLGERPSPDLGTHPGHRAQVSLGATEPRRRSPPKDQRERARAGALPLGALYTAAVVAFVLYKCLQGKDEAAVFQKEKGKKESLQSERHLAQLTQQLAQTEQHLNNLMAQLDPLFERVTTLVGVQRQLLNMKLQTIHQLLQDCTSDKEDLRTEEDEEAGDSQDWEEPINWRTETSWEVEQGLRRRCSKTVTKDPRYSFSQGQQLKV